MVAWALLLVFLQAVWFLTGLDDKWVDHLFHLRGMQPGDPRLVIVEMDDVSIERIGSYPLPRSVWGRLADQLFALGAEIVALDVIFPDPAPSPQEDTALVEATQRYGERLVHSVSVDPNIINEHAFVFPFEELRQVAKSMGLIYQPLLDHDGMIRRTPLIVGRRPKTESHTWVSDPHAVPSLGLVALARYEARSVQDYLHLGPSLQLNVRGQRKVVIGKIMVAGVEQNIVDTLYALPRIPLWKILESELSTLEERLLRGAIVLVGSTASAAFDHYPTPFTSSAPGVEIHATLIDNILNDRWLRPPSQPLAIVLILVFAVFAYWLLRFGPIQGFLVFFAVLGVWVGVTYYAFLQHRLVNFVGPAAAFAGTFFMLIVHKVRLEQLEKRAVRQMFGQYVAPEVVAELVKDRDKLRLGGQKRDMSIFFLDIAHFTTISEKMAPENLIQFLNYYLTALTDDVLRYRGVVDKYIGDCVMAFWNAPLEVPDHRKQACFAAIDCMNTIQRLNKEYVDPTMPEKPAVRIGLNSGEVIVGNTGSERKLAYTVLGDEVNLASRLEGANKFFGSTIMVSENTYEDAKDEVEARLLGRVRVVGKEKPIRVYELLGRQGQLSEEWAEALRHWCQGIELYEKRTFVEAKTEFEFVLKLIPEDKPSKLYLGACEDCIAMPPPDTWDAVFNLTLK
jgi:adenylate cyclase